MVSNPRILIIEDNPINVIVTKKFIEDICQVDTATNSKTALQKLSENQYDMILMDLNLGHDDSLTGVDILWQIRQDSQMSDIPVVAITAYSDDLEMNQHTVHQFSKVIRKPIDKPTLIQVIREFLTI